MSKKRTIQECKNFAISKNGLCLSDEYKDNKHLLLWQCENGHRWYAKWNNIIKTNGPTWCAECYFQSRRVNIEIIKEFAKSKNGKLLSTEYINNHVNLIWECSEGHQWPATWNSIKDAKSWCPNCSVLKSEKKCRQILENYYNAIFYKKSFYYRNQLLMWDGYCDEYKIAFEYNGKQHYEYPNHCHRSEQDFIMQYERDLMKQEYALENKIKLYIIPYTEEDNLDNYVLSLCKNPI